MGDGAQEIGGAEPVFEVAGNRLRLVTGGPERLDALIALIDGARVSLRLLTYIYSPDAAGVRVREALVAARGRGVTVDIIIDGFGSDAGDDFLAPLRDAGAHLCRFHPSWGRSYLLRNHQKLLLADGEEDGRLITGGFNLAADYFAGGGADAWRDLGLVLEGPAAAHLAGYFDALALWTRTPRAPLRTLRRALREWSDTEGPIRWLFGGPTRRLNPWVRALRRDMKAAMRIDMIAAYFSPNPAMLRRLRRRARAGASVRVLTAARSDNAATIGAARFCFARLLRRGVRVFEYMPSKLHTKLYVIDDAVHIGSANFDMRSLYLNLELMLRVEDAAFARRLRAYLDGELAVSEEITRATHRARATLVNRILWFCDYTLVAVIDYTISRRLNFGREAR